MHQLDPQQRCDFDTLKSLVAAGLGEIYNDMDMILALREANFDTTEAFLALKKRCDVTKKRSLFDDDTWRYPKRRSASLPANVSSYSRFVTPLYCVSEADARDSKRILASAPSPLPPTQSREGDPICAANLLAKHLSSRLNPFKEETEHSLEEVLEKLAVDWTSDTKNLLEQACAALVNTAKKTFFNKNHKNFHVSLAIRLPAAYEKDLAIFYWGLKCMQATKYQMGGPKDSGKDPLPYSLYQASSFDRTQASNLLLEMLSLLPHVDSKDALGITPSEDDVHQSDQAAMAASLAALSKSEDKVEALTLACHRHVTRLESYRNANKVL
ncbi:unnamed protein product [Aphanomyces euteiches]